VRANVLTGRHSPFGATTNAPGAAGRSGVLSRGHPAELGGVFFDSPPARIARVIVHVVAMQV
jgi:hypothetical protein